MDISSSEQAITSQSEGEKSNSLPNEKHPIDPGLLEVALALAALSVAVAVIPFELPNLVHRWLAVPVVISAVISFILSYMSFGDFYSKYISEHGKTFPGWWFGRERRVIVKFRLDPYRELWMAIRFFGISLILLLAGIALNWLMNFK